MKEDVSYWDTFSENQQNLQREKKCYIILKKEQAGNTQLERKDAIAARINVDKTQTSIIFTHSTAECPA